MFKIDLSDLKRPNLRFVKTEALGGMLLIFFALLAMILANSPIKKEYHDFWEYIVSIKIHKWDISYTIHHWINDGLMTIFFLVVGLEIKREILVGELSTPKKAMMPVMAALGGMVFPIALFFLINGRGEGSEGWGIPMATDIAFSIGVLSLFGKKAPLPLKVFLTAFAIVDDLGAVLVIALFYSSNLMWSALILSAILLLILYIGNRFNVHNKSFYLIIGFFIWLLFLHSGIHATIAGVLVALMIPLNPKIKSAQFVQEIKDETEAFYQEDIEKDLTLTHKQLERIDSIEAKVNYVQSPLQSLEHRLHNFTTYFIMPLFALANAGVHLDHFGLSSFQGVALAIFIGLLIGKIVGITLFSWIAVKLNIATLPKGMNIKSLIGLSMLGGIGFTMSIFIATLSFSNEEMLNQAKIGILTASILAGLLGYFFLRYVFDAQISKKVAK